jgi:hypothetical protein
VVLVGGKRERGLQEARTCRSEPGAPSLALVDDITVCSVCRWKRNRCLQAADLVGWTGLTSARARAARPREGSGSWHRDNTMAKRRLCSLAFPLQVLGFEAWTSERQSQVRLSIHRRSLLTPTHVMQRHCPGAPSIAVCQTWMFRFHGNRGCRRIYS